METVTQSSMVKSQPGIGVSYMSGSDIDGVILRVSRYYQNLKNEFGGIGVFKYADCNGKRFNTLKEANEFALKRGYLMPYFKKRY